MDSLEKLEQYIAENKLEEAVDMIVSQYENYKDNIIFLNLKAITCIKIGEFQSAIEDLKSAVSLDVTYADSYFNLGYIYEMMGDHSEAAINYGYAEKYTKDQTLRQELKKYYKDVPTLRQIMDIIAEGKKKHFMILSSCGWSGALQRMQHIARSLVKLGQDVTYICAEVMIDLSTQLKNTKVDEQVIISLQEQMMHHTMQTTKRDIDGITIYTPFSNLLNEQRTLSNYQAVCQKVIDENKEVVIISYLPSQIAVINELKGDFKVIYECVDDHLDTAYVNWGKEQDALFEYQLKERADAITTTATGLFLRNAIEEKRKNVYLSRNAVTYSDFAIKEEYIPEDIKDIPTPRIIYTGAIYEWFDMTLFNKIVEQNPDKSFIIVGFGKEELFTKIYDNLYLLGEKKHSELKYYLKQCDAAIIPFKDDIDLIVNCDPIKQYEYIMCELPVITTYIAECIIGKPMVYLIDSAEKFQNRFREILQSTVSNELIDFAIENSWYSRAAILCDLAGEKSYLWDTNKQIENIEMQLNDIIEKNEVLKTMQSKCLVDKDFKKAIMIAKESYESLPINYVEQNYIYLLSQSKNEKEIFDVVMHSKHIHKQLIDEYRYCYQHNHYDMLYILRLLMKKDYMSVIKELVNVQGVSKLQVMAYCYYQLGERQEALKIIGGLRKKEMSPLGLYLYQKLK